MKTFEILELHKDKIIENWLKKLGESMPIVNDHEKSAIENNVPELLEAIIKALQIKDQHKVVEHSKQHGFERTRFKEYSLRHIIQEYNLFKKEILHTIDPHSKISPFERDTIMEMVDNAIEQSAEIFHRIKQGVQVNARQIAQKQAEKLQLEDEKREEYICSITHDLNNPLNNIKGCISLLEGDLEVGEVHEILRILKTSSDQAESLIKEILDVGKISTNEKIPVKKRSVNVSEELRNEIRVYQVSQKSDIVLISNTDNIYFDLDVDLLIRAFNNLLNNALKHGEKGSKIVVTCELDGNLVIGVHNSGKVIPEEVQESIFNRYYQLSGKQKGWGIGLAFVKEIMLAHGGEVSVQSNEKDGTRFELRFPDGE